MARSKKRSRRTTKKKRKVLRRNRKKPTIKVEVKKIPAIGSRAQVMHGNAKHTVGGLKKSALTMNEKTGRIVPKKKRSLAFKKTGQLSVWRQCVSQAQPGKKKHLKIFVPKKGTLVYKKAKALFDKKYKPKNNKKKTRRGSKRSRCPQRSRRGSKRSRRPQRSRRSRRGSKRSRRSRR